MVSMAEPLSEGVEVRETGAGKFQVEIRAAGVILLADEPVEVGGLGSGPTPYDLLSSALGACTVMTLRLYADRKGWPLRSAAVRVLHSRSGKDRFAREVVLDGALTPDQRRRLLEIANRCPVHRALEDGVELVTVLAESPLPGKLDPAPIAHKIEMERACQD